MMIIIVIVVVVIIIIIIIIIIISPPHSMAIYHLKSGPLAMAMYGISTLLLIDHLRKNTSVDQVWYADDSAAGGSRQNLNL